VLINLLRTHRWIRVSLSGLSVALLLGGLGLVGYPFFTNVYQGRIQAQLDDQLVSPELQQAYKDRKVETGDSLTRIRIPAIDVDVVVVEGITPSALRAGAGHYPATALPCEGGNVAIAGHRTTYGRPFGNLDQLKAGDTIDLITPIGACQYKITKAPFAIPPTELGVIAPSDGKMVTLTTCHPKGSAAERLVVQGTWVQDIKAA
jgi:sortase A